MSDQPLIVFAQDREAPTLRQLQVILAGMGIPATLGTDIAGEASDEELDNPQWDAAFVRWMEPEMHEVLLIEREIREEEAEAEEKIAEHLRLVANNEDVGGQMIMSDHLRKTLALYTMQIMPALIADEDHAAWEALNLVTQFLAQQTNGLIYAEAAGYYDAEGELLLEEAEFEETPE